MPSDELRRRATEARLQVAIDGPAGAGKSTVGAALGRALGCLWLDTGLMYRAITRLAGEAGVSPSNEQALAALAGSTEFELHGGALAVNGRPVSDDLFGPDVDASVSAVSAHPAVRTSLVAWQRRLARGRCIVMVGRDIGTVVLPNARVKLWLTASPEERARRREAQRSGQAGGQTLARLEARDRVDAGRFTSPARPAPDAVVIDTDGLDPEAVVQLALEAVGSALEGPS